MTKRLFGLALLGAAAVSFALPATPAYACWTFPDWCVQHLVETADDCRVVSGRTICPPTS